VVLLLNRKDSTFSEDGSEMCILLTSYANNDEERIKWYMYAINNYLEHTQLKLRLVDSSGHTFQIEESERFKQYSFVQPEGMPSSTHQESYAILEAEKSGLLDGFDTVFKLTCKYYLPELEKELETVPKDVDIIYQNAGAQNSELFGFSKNLLKNIFEKVLNGDKIMEDQIHNIHEELGVKSHRLKPLEIQCGESCPSRANTSILKYL
jgi:hypothetical protein